MSRAPALDSIPAALRAEARFNLWRYEHRGGPKPTKVPLDRNGEYAASVTDIRNRMTFTEALAASLRVDGVGFVLGDGWAGVDLDDCRNPDTGEIAPAAWEIIRHLDSYTEVSPSGTGVKVFLRGRLPMGGNRRKHPAPGIGEIEMYDEGRYFTVTGEHLEGTPTTVEDRQAALEALHAELFPPEPAREARPSAPVDMSDVDSLEKARNARNGAAFTALWDGDTSAYGGDESRADMALMNDLAFWTGRDAERMERLFSISGLGQRDK